MLPETATPGPGPSPRRVALILAAGVLLLAAGGAIWFVRFAGEVRRDPALIYREPATLDKLLKRAEEASAPGIVRRRLPPTGSWPTWGRGPVRS